MNISYIDPSISSWKFIRTFFPSKNKFDQTENALELFAKYFGLDFSEKHSGLLLDNIIRDEDNRIVLDLVKFITSVKIIVEDIYCIIKENYSVFSKKEKKLVKNNLDVIKVTFVLLVLDKLNEPTFIEDQTLSTVLDTIMATDSSNINFVLNKKSCSIL